MCAIDDFVRKYNQLQYSGNASARFDCPICRTSTGYVRLWEDLESEMEPQGGHEAPETREPNDETGRKRRNNEGDEEGPSASKRANIVQ